MYDASPDARSIDGEDSRPPAREMTWSAGDLASELRGHAPGMWRSGDGARTNGERDRVQGFAKAARSVAGKAGGGSGAREGRHGRRFSQGPGPSPRAAGTRGSNCPGSMGEGRALPNATTPPHPGNRAASRGREAPLRKLDYIQNNIIVPVIQEILTLLRPQRLEVFQETVVPTLPIDNDAQLNEFEEYLSTTENYNNMKLKFNHVGISHGAAGTTRKILKSLITSKHLYVKLMVNMIRKTMFTEWVNDYKKRMKNYGTNLVASREETMISRAESRELISAVSEEDDDDGMPALVPAVCVSEKLQSVGHGDLVASSSAPPAKRGAVSLDVESVDKMKSKSSGGFDSLFDVPIESYGIQQYVSKVDNKPVSWSRGPPVPPVSDNFVHKAISSESTQVIEDAIKDWLKQAKTRVMSRLLVEPSQD
ncbi:PREDICTED: uncharacterized protein LOC105449817 [Wasmannia auropunctata]|uniref:uncharacterized protein LOC105449817 n=1 Tax=Wasmannia auropunctata TaxID=64793 RepID=UPI0005EFC825|nr:PREDICTED: uncharacterized protein LOC105449817 [Wasmannia auropunctata]